MSVLELPVRRVAPAPLEYAPRSAFFRVHTCELVSYHAPEPVMTEFHHQKPVFLQNRLYGRILFGPSLWVCSNCHDSVHAWLYWLLGEWSKPPWIGRAAKAEAEATFAWYTSQPGAYRLASLDQHELALS